MNKFEELERIQKLRQNNVLTEQEFEFEKQKILNDTSADTNNTTTQNEKLKQRIKPCEIVLIVVLIVVVRIYNVYYCQGSYKQL